MAEPGAIVLSDTPSLPRDSPSTAAVTNFPHPPQIRNSQTKRPQPSTPQPSEKAILQAAVTTAGRVVAAKSTIQALEGVLMEAEGDHLRISGYNLETGIVTQVEAGKGFPLHSGCHKLSTAPTDQEQPNKASTAFHTTAHKIVEPAAKQKDPKTGSGPLRQINWTGFSPIGAAACVWLLTQVVPMVDA